MDTISPATAISLATTLLPLAYYQANHCFGRMRDSTKIKKNVLVLPTKGGKGYLKTKVESANLLVVDVDEYLKDFNSPKDLDRLKQAHASGKLHEYSLYYKTCADKCLDFVKTQIKHNHKLRVLFVTSSYAFATNFKRDSICIASPDSDFYDSILEPLEAEQRETLRKERSFMLASIPTQNAVNVYNSYADLEKLVRSRLGVFHKL